MRSSSGEIRVASASESPEIIIRRVSAIKGEEGSAHVQRFGGEAIYEVSGSSKGIGPVEGGHGCLEEQGAGDIVGGAKHAFGFAILLRGVGT